MGNTFEKFFAAFGSHKGPKSVVGVDIGSAFVKVVEVHQKNNKIVLDTYGEIALGPLAGFEVGQATNLPIEKLVDATRDLFVEAKVKGRDLVFSLPLSSTLVTVIEMPDVGEEKLREMIPIEARKYIPTPVTEVALSHWIIPKIDRTYVDPDKSDAAKHGTPMVDVLLAVVHNDVIAKYADIAQKLGATSSAFEIEIFSTIRSIVGRDMTATMLVDIGAGDTKIAILEEGVLRSSHLINVGSQDISLALSRSRGISILEAEEIKRQFGLAGDPNDPTIAEIIRLSTERIYGEINRIFLNYEQTKHVNINRIVLSGGGALMKGIVDLTAQNFSVPVVYGNAFEKVEAPAVLTPLLTESGPEFAVAIGLALRNL
jgi:type IV pilus assembly protein PilM